MSKPKLNEADVLFELFLPMLCTERHEALASFKSKIHLRMFGGEAERDWNLTGGAPPWIQRGAVDGAELTLELHEEIVKAIVRGEDPDLDAAMSGGQVRVSGDMKVLRSLEMSLEEATGIVGAMLKR